ncbi:DUF1345 domain-containing protein [Pseudactinotalea sp.]|uniref:DUF1345 domain-containing protein n=1 Tax=Pseudactinotalea sp. TaxID=1926260 RepID=UPI003B3B1FFD
MTDTPTLPRSIWLLSEARRSALSLMAAVPLSFLAVLLLVRLSPELGEVILAGSTDRSLVGAVVAWTIFALIHTGLSWLSYSGLRGEQLRQAAAADPAWLKRHEGGPNVLVRLVVGSGPTSWATSISILALVAVVTMVLRPGLRAVPIVLILAFAMVALSWLNMAVMYAIHYVRANGLGERTDPPLAFPGEQPDQLIEYMYFAAGVQATFGSTDVAIRTSSMRKLVLGHSMMAFVYNTVIVGMVISLLLSAG